MIKDGDPSTVYTDMKKVGEGASGQVFLAIDKRSGERVAVKIAPASDLANLKQEIALQKLSVHPSIVSYKETYMQRDQLWVRAGGRKELLWVRRMRMGNTRGIARSLMARPFGGACHSPSARRFTPFL